VAKEALVDADRRAKRQTAAGLAVIRRRATAAAVGTSKPNIARHIIVIDTH